MSTREDTHQHLTLRDAARRIGVHENTIRNWVSRGLLQPVKVADSRYQRFRADDIDRVAHQQQISSEKARRTEGTTELVDADYLELWAGSRQAEDLLPEVVARLIAGTPGVVGIHMRTGDGIRTSGWDGLVEDSPGSPWVPAGPSAWELGTSGDPRRKAEADYGVRTGKPLEVEPSATTFVFVTPRRWPGARQWERERWGENQWRHVRVLDADDLAGWLRSQPGTHLWFSEEVGLQPLDVRTLGQWWDRYRRQIEPALPPELLLAGRAAAASRLLDRVASLPPSVIFVRGASRDEATAFIASAFSTFKDAPKDALIATSSKGWERLSLASQAGVLIPHFDDPHTATALAMGHQVIVPLPAGTTPYRGEVIELGLLDRSIARDVLAQKSSFSFTTADRLAGLARRSLASFFRDPELTAAPRSSPPWAQGGRARLIASLTLAGAWTGTEADRQAVAHIAGKDWQSVEDELLAVSDSGDPPFVQIGGHWQVVSPDGAWALVRHAAQATDVERFCATAIEILGESDPTLVLDPEERLRAHVRGIRRQFSDTLLQGVTQGLALLGACGTDPSDNSDSRSDADYAKLAVGALLKRANDDASGLLWRSIAPYLQLLAEAAPSQLLNAVETGLEGNNPVLQIMFTDQQRGPTLASSSEHIGLLWALELLCWAPEYLSRAASALARLTEIDPGGRLDNRPDRSLRAVFLPWMPQTSASLSTRLEVLDRLRVSFPGITWKLEIAILPTGTDVASLTPRPRFQQWPTTDERASLSQWLEAIAMTTARAIVDAGEDPLRWSELVGRVPDLPVEQRDQVVAALGALSPKTMDGAPRAKLWQTLIALITRHRQHPEARWALDDETLRRLETVAEQLKPDDLVGRFAPYFDWDPPLPDVPRSDFRKREQAAADVRADAVQLILGHLGFAGIELLARASKLPEHVGACTAEVAPGEHFPDVRSLLGRDAELRRFAQGWIARMAKVGTWLDDRTAEMHGWPIATQIRFLLALRALNAQIITVIESLDAGVQRQFWESIQPVNVDDDALAAVVERLLAYGRPWAAIDLLSLACHRPDGNVSSALSAEIVGNALDYALASDSVDPGSASRAAYDIGLLLDYLEAAGVDETTQARFEWNFFRVIEHTRQPRALFRALSNDPGIFVELISYVYRAKKAPASGEADERTVAIAQNAWSVLQAWRPQLDASGGIATQNLRSWVQRARAGLAACDRADIGDHQIGQTLSGSSVGADGIWPPEEVRELIEDLASSNLESGLGIGALNSREPTRRGFYDGGAQEWSLSARYRIWGQAVINRWQRTGRVLMQLADDYERRARREDLEARALASDF